MNRGRFAILGALAAIIVLIMVFGTDGNNSIKDIKPYLSAAASAESLDIRDYDDLKEDWGIIGEETDGFLYYSKDLLLDQRQILVIKAVDSTQAYEIRHIMQEHLEGYKTQYAKSGDEALALFKKARIMKRGNFVMFVIANDPRAACRAFAAAVRK